MSGARNPTTTALAVANFFVRKGIEAGMEVDQLKLQKLTYYAFAWWAAFNKERLFFEPIEAWQHGPVVKKVWQKFRHNGSDLINSLASDFDVTNGALSVNTPRVRDFQIEAFLKDVWDTYKDFTGVQLSNKTHEADEPWQQVRARARLSERPEIPFELIRDMFSRKTATG